MNTQKIKTPPNWQQVKLGDIGKVSMCKRVFKHETFSQGPIPFYKISTFGKIADSFISEDLFEKYKNNYPYPKKGEVLISASGTIGRLVVFNGEKSYFQDSNIVWISNSQNKVLNKFLEYVYTKTRWISTDGGIISRLYNNDLRSIKFILPPLPEQHRIVSILETWDSAIEKLSKKIKLKKQLKKGLMQKLLTGDVRFPGFSGEWKMVKLGSLVDVVSGGTPSTTNEKFWNGEIPWITPTEITKLKDRFIEDTRKHITEAGLKKSSATKIPPMSLILCSRATVGACAINLKEITTNQGFKNLVPKKIDIYFLYYLIKTKKNNLVCISSGSTFLEFSKKDIQKMKVFSPSQEEQKAIANILNTSDHEIDILQQKLEELKKQKKYLLNKLVTGEIRTPESIN